MKLTWTDLVDKTIVCGDDCLNVTYSERLEEILEKLHATHGTGGDYLSPAKAKQSILSLLKESLPEAKKEIIGQLVRVRESVKQMDTIVQGYGPNFDTRKIAQSAMLTIDEILKEIG